MTRNASSESFQSSMFWVIGLTAFAIGVPFSISLCFLLSSAAIFALRGSIFAFFGIGGVVMVSAFLVTRIKSYSQRLNLITLILIFGVALVVSAIAGGVDITQMITAPVTFARLVGNRVVNALDRRKQPSDLHQGRQVLGEVVGGVAISFLINIAPFPWNMMIFLSYYKLVTAIIFCVLPTVLSLWVLVKLWFARKKLKEDNLEDEISFDGLGGDDASSEEDDAIFRRRLTDSSTIVQSGYRHPRVYVHGQQGFGQSRSDRPFIPTNYTHEKHALYPSV